MPGHVPFLPGVYPDNPGPLGRFLPPIPEGTVTAWLHQHVPPGTWVLDPFGASPRLAVEIAHAGYRVLVAANNPVARHLLEFVANPPTESELRAALAELAAAHRGEERIEPHIRSLYATECGNCGKRIMADYYLWERGEATPYARFYHCSYCDDAGEHPVTPGDYARAEQIGQSGLYKARALERVVPLGDPDREHVIEALEAYLPRAVYALFILVNKLDGLPVSVERRFLLHSLLLNAFDQANTLWHTPMQRERPKQLTTPPRFRENNIWVALEQSIEAWVSAFPPLVDQPKLPVVIWPDIPGPAEGISLFEGRLKELATTLAGIEIGAVVTAMPRPNQAYWTLSALWAGWLWGRQAVAPFKSVLRRRRYDWGWHTSALSAALGNLAPVLAPGTPFFGLISEAEPGFMSAAIVATEGAGFDLEGIAIRPEHDHAQITWKRSFALVEKTSQTDISPTPADDRSDGGDPIEIVRKSVIKYLQQRGQPAPYLLIHCVGLSTLAQAHAFQQVTSPETTQTGSQEEQTPADIFSHVQAAFRQAFTTRGGFLRYEGSDQNLEVGSWWLSEIERPPQSSAPMADLVELALVKHLNTHPRKTFLEVDKALCEAFPGLHTPDLDLIRICLDSYGEQEPPESGLWSLRPQELPSVRWNDLISARDMLLNLGRQLGFHTNEGLPHTVVNIAGQNIVSPYFWLDEKGVVRYILYNLTSAAFGEIVLNNQFPASQSIIVLPGGRANLVAFKLRSDPHLRQEIEKGWRFLKYRHLRQLVDSPLVTRETIDEQLGLDPLTYSMPQIRLL